MSFFKTIKVNSKLALRNNWPKAIAIVFLFLSISLLFNILRVIFAFLFGIISYYDVFQTPTLFFDNLPNISYISLIFHGIFLLLITITMVPLTIGLKKWYYGLTENKSYDIISIFSFFSSRKMFFRSIFMYIGIYVRLFFWAIPLFLPSVALFVACENIKNEPEYFIIHSMLWVCTIVLFIISIFIFSVIKSRYFVAPYLLLNKENSSSKAISLSIKLTKGERANIFLFRVSFIFYQMLNVFMFPVLYTMPYINTSYAMYARYLIEKYNYEKSITTKQFDTLSLQDENKNTQSEL